MTYEQAKFNADVMTKIIRYNLVTGGNAKIAYDGCEPEVQCLVNCQLTHSEKRVLGIVADGELDPLELALRTCTRERQEIRFGKNFDAVRVLNSRAKLYYDLLKAA